MSRSQSRLHGPGADDPAERGKDRYHHGDLRESLISATRALVVSHGAENFSLADACRFAGVSTAAPYKHFRDKQEILEIVCQRSFDEMRAKAESAVANAGAGSARAIQEMGRAYVNFARSEPNLFRLMFGQNPALKHAQIVDLAGTGCFAYVMGQVAQFCERENSPADPRLVALKLWTFVHGAACLLIDEDYQKIAPDLDVDALIISATPQPGARRHGS